MGKTAFEKRLFENDGNGPLLREDILPSTYHSLPLFSRISMPSDLPEDGFLRMDIDSGPLSRAAFPQAWAKIQQMIDAGSDQVLSDTDWLTDRTNKGFSDKFSKGDGSTTFRVPHVPLEYWYGTTRIGSLLRTVSVPALSSETSVLDEVMTQNVWIFMQLNAPNGQAGRINGFINGKRFVLDIVQATVSNVYNSANIYAHKGDRIQISIGSSQASGSAIYIYEVPAPLEIPYIKMYGAVTEAGEVNIAELIQQATTLGGQVEANASYSTSEQWTGGYWIDGKKIYRKVVDCGALPNATTKTVAHGIYNIANVLSMKGWAYSSTKGFINMPFPMPGNAAYGLSLTMPLPLASISLSTSSNYSDYAVSYCILEYTCTDR